MDPDFLDNLDNNDDQGTSNADTATTATDDAATGADAGAPDAGQGAAAPAAEARGDEPGGSQPDGDGAGARAAAPAAPAPDAAAGGQPKGVVPHAALAEERERTRALRTELNELKTRLPTAEEMQAFRAWQKQQQDAAAKAAAPPPPPAPPAFTEDPEGHIAAREKQLVSKLEQVEKVATEAAAKVNETAQQQQLREQAATIARSITEAETQFKASTPDYEAALRHLRQIRIDTIRDMNPDATDDQIAQTILTDEARTAAQLLAAGKNPAEYTYRVAQRFGYRPAAPAQAPAPGAADAARAFKGDDAAAREAARTMGSGGAADGDGEGGTDHTTEELFEARAERFGRGR